MSTPTTQVNTRGGKGTTNPPTDTAKQNYTAQTIGKNTKNDRVEKADCGTLRKL